MSGKAVQDFLYRECGLKDLSGISNDMREGVRSSPTPNKTQAREATEKPDYCPAARCARARMGLFCASSGALTDEFWADSSPSSSSSHLCSATSDSLTGGFRGKIAARAGYGH